MITAAEGAELNNAISASIAALNEVARWYCIPRRSRTYQRMDDAVMRMENARDALWRRFAAREEDI